MRRHMWTASRGILRDIESEEMKVGQKKIAMTTVKPTRTNIKVFIVLIRLLLLFLWEF